MASVYTATQELEIRPDALVGEGGEAEVYRCGKDLAVKIFKGPDHPDFNASSSTRQLVESKLKELQNKLPAFPSGLPREVVAPLELLYWDASRKTIAGYTMKYLDGVVALRCLTDQDYRRKGSIDDVQIACLFRNIHDTLSAIHRRNVVVGDFNTLNILVEGERAYFIDADSMQFGPFFCPSYTTRYLDPTNLDATSAAPAPASPHSPNSDWYAFAVILFECLLFVHPYGGVFRPADPARRVAPDQRPRHRITVLHPEVCYPQAGVPFGDLPLELQYYFRCLLEQDRRGEFPRRLLELIARRKGSLPVGSPAMRSGLSLTDRQGITARKIVAGQGTILCVEVDDSRLRFLIFQAGQYRRESGVIIMSGGLEPGTTFGLCQEETIVARGQKAMILTPGASPRRISIDSFRGRLPVMAAGNAGCFWVDGGHVWKKTSTGQQLLGEALSHQTRIWIGPSFGFAFYQAGELRRAFLFSLDESYRVPLPHQLVPSRLVDVTCCFTDHVLWLLTTHNDGRELVNTCTLVDRDGQVMAQVESGESDSFWLGRITGKCAVSKPCAGGQTHFLLSSGNGCIARIDYACGKVQQVCEFEAPTVTSAHNLSHSLHGLYAWSTNEIQVLSTTGNTS